MPETLPSTPKEAQALRQGLKQAQSDLAIVEAMLQIRDSVHKCRLRHELKGQNGEVLDQCPHDMRMGRLGCAHGNAAYQLARVCDRLGEYELGESVLGLRGEIGTLDYQAGRLDETSNEGWQRQSINTQHDAYTEELIAVAQLVQERLVKEIGKETA